MGVSPESKARDTPARGSFWDLQTRVCQTMGETRPSSKLSHPFRPLPSPTFRRPCPIADHLFPVSPTPADHFANRLLTPAADACPLRRVGVPWLTCKSHPRYRRSKSVLTASVSERTARSGFLLIGRRREHLIVMPKVTVTGPRPDGSWR